MKKDSLDIEAQFWNGDEAYMMLVDGSCYRMTFNYITPFEPISRSYYGHVLKTKRKDVMRQNADMYFKRNLAKKGKNFLAVEDYTTYINAHKEEVDKYNALWTQFKQHIAADKQKRRAAKLASKQ